MINLKYKVVHNLYLTSGVEEKERKRFMTIKSRTQIPQKADTREVEQNPYWTLAADAGPVDP